MTRRTFFALAAPPPKLNIVLILADDLGWSDLACYGADLHETPHLDQLARDGLRFTHAFSASPVCSPTRASLITGKHPARLGITIWHEGALTSQQTKRPIKTKLREAVSESQLPHAETTIAELFQSAGYRTALIGKWHLGPASHAPETQGFEVNLGGTHWGAPATFFYPYRGTQRFGGEFRFVPSLGQGKPGDYLTDRLTDVTLPLINKQAPFFLYLAHHAPHTPIEAPKALVEKYQRKLKPGLHHQNATYAAMVESFDASVGRVRAELKRQGLHSNTVVIVMSDNGGFINQSEGAKVTDNHPLRSGKGSVYEGGVRVPLIVYWPGVTRPGTTCDEPVVSTDLFHTLRELVAPGLAPVQDGLSLTPLLRDPQTRLPREALYFHYPHYYQTTTPATAIRTRDWKLIEYYEDHRYELYNLKSDPAEQHNLAAAEPARVAELKAQLDAWKRSVGARLPTAKTE